MPPPRPHLMDELVEECFLRLPPYDPATLVRAALVCKRWHRILADRGFRRRFSKLHHGRTPSMLGFLHVSNAVARFTPTTSFRLRKADVLRLRGRRAIDSRHGRVLLASPPSLSNLTVWDPITGEQVNLPDPRHRGRRFNFLNSRAAVLCAAPGGTCDHVDCHRGHFVVVLMHITNHKVDAHVYSSRAGAWSQTTSTDQDPGDGRHFILLEPCAFAGNTLYFRVFRTMGTGILKYDLGAQEIGFVDPPPDCADVMCRILLTTREDDGLGVAKIENSRIHLWSMDGVLGWAPSGVIDLETMLPDPVHGLGAFFVQVHAGVFTVDPVSGRVRKVADNRLAGICFVPYTSFCVPAFEEGRNQVHGVSK